MTAELIEQTQFLKGLPPFDTLSNEVLADVVSCMNIGYARRGDALSPRQLYVIRKGLIEITEAHESGVGYSRPTIDTPLTPEALNPPSTLDTLDEGESFYIEDQPQHYNVTKDALVYYWPISQLKRVLIKQPEVLAYWFTNPEQRIQTSVDLLQVQSSQASPLTSLTVEQFAHVPAATIRRGESIKSAAQQMTTLGYSSLVVVEADGSHVSSTTPIGIVTDKDIRSRCVATGLSISNVVSDIMSDDMITIDANAMAFDALLTMIEHSIHHLPVVKNKNLYGMLTLTDLMHKEGQNAVHLTSAIKKANSVQQLAVIGQTIPQLQHNLTKLGIGALPIAKSISALVKSITSKLVTLAEQALGPAPVPYLWVCAGSLARGEQFAHADQDNALIYSDDCADDDKAYFDQLADFVCDGLNACGFIYCPGNIMASNPKWCQPQSTWMRYFENWINRPNPKALMHCSIFFDIEGVVGDHTLLATIKEQVLTQTQKSTLFLAHLSKNALSNRPPLGFFKDFVLIPSGEHKATIDLKHNAIAPIVDLARIYALSTGIQATSTLERLQQVAGTCAVTAPSAKSLIAAFEFILELRLEVQSEQIKAGKAPSNYMQPNAISRLQRRHLKDVFKVIKTLQDARQVVY